MTAWLARAERRFTYDSLTGLPSNEPREVIDRVAYETVEEAMLQHAHDVVIASSTNSPPGGRGQWVEDADGKRLPAAQHRAAEKAYREAWEASHVVSHQGGVRYVELDSSQHLAAVRGALGA